MFKNIIIFLLCISIFIQGCSSGPQCSKEAICDSFDANKDRGNFPKTKSDGDDALDDLASILFILGFVILAVGVAVVINSTIEYVVKPTVHFVRHPIKTISGTCECQQCKPLGLSNGPPPRQRLDTIQRLNNKIDTLSPERYDECATTLKITIEYDSDPQVRLAAVKTLARLPNAMADMALTSAMADASPAVRKEACQIWAKRPQPQLGAKSLNKLLWTESDPEVILAAIESLAVCGNENSPYILRKFLDSPDYLIQTQTVKTLQTLTGEQNEDLNFWRMRCTPRQNAQVNQIQAPAAAVAPSVQPEAAPVYSSREYMVPAE